MVAEASDALKKSGQSPQSSRHEVSVPIRETRYCQPIDAGVELASAMGSKFDRLRRNVHAVVGHLFAKSQLQSRKVVWQG